MATRVVKSCVAGGLAALLFASAPMASAAVVGYWRMEDSNNLGLDSGPNGLNLTNYGGTATPQVVYAPHPVSGDGSYFPSTITGVGANTGQAVWSGATGAERNATTGQQGLILQYTSQSVLAGLSSFTAEAFVNSDQFLTWESNIVSLYRGASGTQSGNTFTFRTSTNGANKELSLSMGSGTSGKTYWSGVTLLTDKDYYVAVSFDLTKQGTGTAGVTFYIQNLTDNGPLQVISKDIDTGTIVNAPASTYSYLEIGARKESSYMARGDMKWNGVIDEVRISDTVLAQGDLLVNSVPEPASLSVLLIGGGLLAMRRRRQS